MLFDGAIISGTSIEEADRADQTLFFRDLQRDPATALKLRANPQSYLECLLEPELLVDFEDLLEIYHTTEPIRFAVSRLAHGDSPLPRIDAAFRFDLDVVAPPQSHVLPEIPARINLAGAVNLYWKCHSGHETLLLDQWDRKVIAAKH